jgi:DNA polymerase-3 subunit delta'
MIAPWLTAVETEFRERLAGGRLAHALLLAGPAGCGKRELASGFIASLLCLESKYPACGACRSCSLLESGAHPDHQLLTFEDHPKSGEPRKEIVIEQVRRLIAASQLTRGLSPRKTALLEPAEAMTHGAANALLKTLEEPPGEAVLVLVSHHPERLPATIRSRCQNLHVRPPGRTQALAWLTETTNGDAESAALALDAAAGSPLRARRLLEDGSTDQYRLVSESLERLLAATEPPTDAAAAFAGLDPESLWTWLSLRAANEVRRRGASGRDMRPASELQQLADRYRRFVPTPVRKDLLLQDWLIQWSRLKA